MGAHFDITSKHDTGDVCKKCDYHQRRSIWAYMYIMKAICYSLVIALVVSSLDYYNILQLDLPEYHLACLQKIHKKQGSPPGCPHTCVLTPHATTQTTALVACQTTQYVYSTCIYLFIVLKFHFGTIKFYCIVLYTCIRTKLNFHFGVIKFYCVVFIINMQKQ